jgi:cytochrome c-type biogenesis protein CcmH
VSPLWALGRGLWAVSLLATLMLASTRGTEAQPSIVGSKPTAQSPEPDSLLDARTREVAQGLRCPVCQGESIDASPAELAVELKSLVREQLAAGRTPDQVREYFVARYGEWILLKPKAGGANAAVYLLPPLLLVAGAALVVVLLRRWTRASRAEPPVADDAIEPELG